MTRRPFVPTLLNFRHILMVELQHEPDTRPQFEVPPSLSPSLSLPPSTELGSISRKSFSKVECPSLPLFPKCVPIIWQYITVPPFARPPSPPARSRRGRLTAQQSRATAVPLGLKVKTRVVRRHRHRYVCQSTHSDEMQVLDPRPALPTVTTVSAWLFGSPLLFQNTTT